MNCELCCENDKRCGVSMCSTSWTPCSGVCGYRPVWTHRFYFRLQFPAKSKEKMFICTYPRKGTSNFAVWFEPTGPLFVYPSSTIKLPLPLDPRVNQWHPNRQNKGSYHRPGPAVMLRLWPQQQQWQRWLKEAALPTKAVRKKAHRKWYTGGIKFALCLVWASDLCCCSTLLCPLVTPLHGLGICNQSLETRVTFGATRET